MLSLVSARSFGMCIDRDMLLWGKKIYAKLWFYFLEFSPDPIAHSEFLINPSARAENFNVLQASGIWVKIPNQKNQNFLYKIRKGNRRYF